MAPIAPPVTTTLMPRARTAVGYMSAAANLERAVVPVPAPLMSMEATSPPKLPYRIDSPAVRQPSMSMTCPVNSTGLRPSRSISRPA